MHLLDETLGGIAWCPRFRLHLRRTRPLIRSLEAKGLSEPNVLGILAVETFYRPAALRMLEYVVWLTLSVFRAQRVHSISLGRAQVQLAHWRELGLIDSVRFSFKRFARVRDVEINYEVCRRYLQRNQALGEPNPDVLTFVYTGAQRSDYSSMLRAARGAIGSSPG
jgi:hypothetical protein